MDARLSSIQFQSQLHDVHVDAVLLVSTAMQPHLPAFTAHVHAALATLVAAPAKLEPLPDWSGMCALALHLATWVGHTCM